MSKLKARQPETVEPGKTKGIVFGPSGAGKTWGTLDFPAPYYIDTEGGADLRHYQEKLKKSGGVYMGPEDGALDFPTIIDQMQVLSTEKHGFKTLIFDSITKLYQVAIANEAEKLGDKDAFGASKKPAIANMRRLVNWAMRLDMNIWFVAHEVSEWGGTGKDRVEVGKMPDIWDKLVYELDLSLRIQKRGKEFPSTAIIHKSRLLGFPQGESFPWEYAEFAKRYGKDYIEADSKQIVLAKPDQVAELLRLADLLKLTADDCQTLWDKAGANGWNELTEEQADKTIKFYTKKISGGKA